MKYKKIMAVALAATMVVGNSVVAFADDGSVTGTGKLEGTVNTDVFSVVLPSATEDNLAFTLDPEGLISKTNQAAYSSKTFGDGTLFFANTGGTTDYSNTTDKLIVTNKSSVVADVTVTAKLTDYDGITLTDDKTFTDDTSASMYMAIVDKTNTSGVAIGENGATVTAQIDKAPDGAYEYTYDSGTYKYALKSNTDDITFKTYEFTLNGASNAAGDWSGLAAVAPKVELTWTVVAHQDNAAPTIATTQYTMKQSTPIAVSVNLGAGDKQATGVSKVTYLNSAGAERELASSNYSFSGTTLTLTSDYVDSLLAASVSSRDLTIVFDDSASTSITIKLVAE